jgi:hypothetical protein
MNENPKSMLNRVTAPFIEIFGVSRSLAASTILFLSAVTVFACFWFFHSAPPRQITITTGGTGTSFETNAFKYRQILARNGVTLNILPSEGSLENLQRLEDPAFKVDIGFVQGGVSNGPSKLKLVSLGSVSYQPLFVFYRGAPIQLLSELNGKRLAIGPVGSGTRILALSMLQLNDITPHTGNTVLEDIEAEAAAKALLDGSVDAIFLMGDSASPQLMRRLLLTPNIQLLNFIQANGYSRRITYLNKLILPQGSIDFGRNIPSEDLSLIAPTVELLARPGLHPALCDLLIEAAQEVHGGAGLLKNKAEFPAPLEREHPISTEASRYYKSGKGFLYRSLPFSLATLVNRVLVALVPIVVLMIPAIRLLPTFLRLGIRLRFYRWYRVLLTLERELQTSPGQHRPELLARLDHIEREINQTKVPASFADQYYSLRGSIGFVRTTIAKSVTANDNSRLSTKS